MTKKFVISPEFLGEMKSALIEEETRIEAELSKFTHRNPNQGGDYAVVHEEVGSEEGENAFEVAQFGDNLSLEQELEGGLKDVHSALAAMTKGTYGVCKYCQQPISEDRLRVRPTSTSCVACKKTLTQEM